MPEQVDDQGLRDGKGVHTTGDSCYHKKKGGGGGDGSKLVKGKINLQLQKFTPLGLISCATVMYFTPRGEGETRRGPMPLGLFLLPRRQDGF